MLLFVVFYFGDFMVKRNRLTNQEEEFVSHYVSCFNASKAVQLASYDTKYPAQLASQLLKKKHIAKRIEALRQELEESLQVQRSDVVRCAQEIAFDPNNANRDRLKALDLLCRIMGFNAPDRIEVTEKQIVFHEAVFNAGETIDAEIYSTLSKDDIVECKAITCVDSDCGTLLVDTDDETSYNE